MNKIVLFFITPLFVFVPIVVSATTVDEAGFIFLQQNLLDSSGGIYANLDTGYANNPDAGVNHQMLSEYTGIAMEYAVLAGRKTFFSTEHTFANRSLRNTLWNLYHWRILEDGTRAPSNATIDDLRIIDGYLQADATWGRPTYRKIARTMGNSLKRKALRNGVLTNAVSWDADGYYKDTIAWVSYFDLPAMKRLAVYDTAWNTIIDTHVSLIRSASYGNGLYHEQYDIPSKQFIEHDTLNSIHQLFIANHLAEAGYTTEAQQTLDFYEQKYSVTGRIADQYTPTGESDSPYEDIAVYALASELSGFLGDTTFRDEMLQKIRQLQVKDPTSASYGSFQWGEGDTVYSFVQLTALRAFSRVAPMQLSKKARKNGEYRKPRQRHSVRVVQ